MSKSTHRYQRPLFASSLPKAVKKPRINWKPVKILWGAVKRLCMAMGAMFLFSLVFSLLLLFMTANQAQLPSLPDAFVLHLSLDGGLKETQKAASFIDPLSQAGPTMHQLVRAIDRAAGDERVRALSLRLDKPLSGVAKIQELRAAVLRFRETGKKTYIYSPSYFQAGGMSAYYLASAFEEIWMQPMGLVSIPGLNAEVPFFRSVLDEWGVAPQFFQRKDYKNIYESAVSQEMSPESEEATRALLNDLAQTLLYSMAADRGIGSGDFRDLIDEGLFTSTEALEAGLVTHVSYPDLMLRNMKALVTGDEETEDSIIVPYGLYVAHQDDRSDYSQSLGSLFESYNEKGNVLRERPRVALIFINGMIIQSGINAQAGVFSDAGVAAADEIAPAIWNAAEDPSIKTIVLRVDSPGGAPTAAESILRAAQFARSKGKHVVVSMGGSAASGGYWVSSYADQIFAQDTTVTGSIGVAGGKVALDEFWVKADVNWERIGWGENSGIWSLNTPFSEREAKEVNEMLDHVYGSFVDRVAEGRCLLPEFAEEIARGRVWSGKAAQELHLVDQIGGLYDALQYSAQLLGKESRDDIDVVILPKPKTPLEQLVELLVEQGVVGTLQIVLSSWVSALVPDQLITMHRLQAETPVIAYESLRVV